ncbi:MAG: chromate efflux transporter [Aquabacterium commune]|uniref:chromate efflux transporter n=1 Tax=Aquabacterium TaxID=92793 RepID=UPI001D3334C0|nr:chromate efflux transporter [Aquabacterium sp.]MBT9608641.1 chromate efflux transporter [Aquabacterium sp.]
MRLTDAPAPASVTFWQAFRFWLRLGFISFGGPAGQIAILHEELVVRRRWLSERRFLHALNYCMVLPGPEAQQLATYIGWLMHRTWGGIVAGALFVLPSLAILIGLSWVYVAFGQVPWVAGVFYGIKPAVAAIVLQAAHRVGSRALRNRVLWAIAAAAFFGIAVLQLPFPLILALAATAGALGGRMAPALFVAGGGHGSAGPDNGPTVIDDHGPRAEHTVFRWPRLLAVLGVVLGLWLAPMAWMVAQLGWAHTYTQMGWFFTKAAWMTFGGAYAVLPYVVQGAVEHFHWLSPLQMMDGLALGETTPGPLIMVVAFVGYVGAHTQALLGPDAPFLAGALGAALVTWFTFLPSFLFILAGGPLVESSRHELRLTAPLTAITAAVVGVILNLALFFGVHVLWPQGFGHGLQDSLGRLDLPAAALSVAAAVALFRYKRSVMQVIGGAALAGLALRLGGVA